MRERFICWTVLLLVTMLLGACGGGGSSKDITPASSASTPVIVTATTGPDSFLLFPNPQLQDDGTLQTNSAAYTNAYYAAIDPTSARDTMVKWKAVNGVDSGTGTQVTVVFGDPVDLGYGRRMTARQNVDGTYAFIVENYLVRTDGGPYAYSSANLDAAINRDTRWLIGINAIEFSPGPAGGVSFAKFYNFNPTTGARQVMLDMDGRGLKAMPGPCITCHGGRGDALTPPNGGGSQLFNLVQNSASLTRGDVQAHLHGFGLGGFDFSASAGFTRAAQEASLKQMNQWVLCTYPLVAPTAFPEDACRRTATANEWVGTAGDVIKQAYGGNGLPNPVYSDTYVPTSWSTAGQTTLYQNVIAPACRTCHALRGTLNQSDLDFDSYAKFQSYAERVKHHAVDFGNMPLAKIVYDRYMASSGPATTATFLTGQGQTAFDGGGALLVPGRPVTSLSDRVIKQGPTIMTATGTRFATTYAWSVVSGPGGAVPPTSVTLTNANTSQATFNASANGTYVLQLVVGNGTTQSTPATANIVVNNALALAPSAIRFSDIKNVLQTAGCTTCHTPGGTPLPPVFYSNTDRNGDGTVGDATDDAWFYAEVRSRVNLTDSNASALLRKPAGLHHAGGLQPGFDTTKVPGDPARANYDLFLNWILSNAPQ